MIYVTDKFTLKGEQVAVVTKMYPETLITNTGDSIAVIEQSHNNETWTNLVKIKPNESKSVAITTRYIRLNSHTTITAKSTGSNITPLVLADNPLHTGIALDNFSTKDEIESLIQDAMDKLINGADEGSDSFKELADKIAELIEADKTFVTMVSLAEQLKAYATEANLQDTRTQIIQLLESAKSTLQAKDTAQDKEIASLKRTKADLSHTHTMSEVTDLSAELERYALKTELDNISIDTSHLATKSSVDELSEQIATKAEQSHSHAWNSITGKPTTLTGYGITDAISRNTDTEITSLLTINKTDSYIQGKSSNTRKWYIGKGSSFSDDIQLHNFTHSTQLNLTNNKIVASHDLYVNDSKVITASDTTLFVTPDALNQALTAKASTNHQHTIAEISELQNILNSKLNSNASAISAQKLTTPRRINGIAFDGTQDITLPTPTANVSWSAISNKPANFTPSTHSHVIGDITNLQRELDSKASSNHSHAWNSITNKPTTLTGYGIGNAMQTDSDSETTGLISINRADSYIQGKQGSVRRWYVGSGSSSNHNVQLSNSTHNTQLELTNDRITSNKALYVGTRRVLLEGDVTTTPTTQPTNTFVRITVHPVVIIPDSLSYRDSTTFVYPDGRIVHSFIYKNLRQPVFNSITSGGTHVRTLTINLPTAMPRQLVQVNAYFYRPEVTDASFPLIISHKANDTSNSSITLQISGTAREISFSGYLDLVVIVEGF